MATTTILPVLRLTIQDMRDQGSIAIVDLSSYASTPTTFALQITPPGWPTLNVPFTPGAVNVYKCGDLGITCAVQDCCPLPDGIYAVKYSVGLSTSPTFTQLDKTFIKVDQLECRQMNLFLKVDDCDCETKDQKEYKQQVREVDLLKNGAIAAANTGDNLKAHKFYAQADALIDCIYAKFCSYCAPIPSCDQCN